MAQSTGQTDRHLWKLILADDPQAWKRLVSKYQALVYTVAVRCGLSAADASDCFQQTWLSLYRTRKQLADPAKLVAWLIVTTRREAVRMRRRANSAADLEQAMEVPSSAPCPDRELEILERQLLLRAALEHLGARDRKLIEELFLAPQTRTYDDIAASLGVAVNSLGPTRRRVLAKLRRILEAMGLPDVRNREWVPLLIIEEYEVIKESRVTASEPPGHY